MTRTVWKRCQTMVSMARQNTRSYRLLLRQFFLSPSCPSTTKPTQTLPQRRWRTWIVQRSNNQSHAFFESTTTSSFLPQPFTLPTIFIIIVTFDSDHWWCYPCLRYSCFEARRFIVVFLLLLSFIFMWQGRDCSRNRCVPCSYRCFFVVAWIDPLP